MEGEGGEGGRETVTEEGNRGGREGRNARGKCREESSPRKWHYIMPFMSRGFPLGIAGDTCLLNYTRTAILDDVDRCEQMKLAQCDRREGECVRKGMREGVGEGGREGECVRRNEGVKE